RRPLSAPFLRAASAAPRVTVEDDRRSFRSSIARKHERLPASGHGGSAGGGTAHTGGHRTTKGGTTMKTQTAFHSSLAPDLRRYIAHKQALGRRFQAAFASLLHLDRVLCTLCHPPP